MQHSVNKYHSQRYANLDDIDEPLNDMDDLQEDLDDARNLSSEQQRLAKITEITADRASRLAASESKPSIANWPNWTVEFDDYQRRRSGLFKPFSAGENE
jgi:hypothetical protein